MKGYTIILRERTLPPPPTAKTITIITHGYKRVQRMCARIWKGIALR